MCIIIITISSTEYTVPSYQLFRHDRNARPHLRVTKEMFYHVNEHWSRFSQ